MKLFHFTIFLIFITISHQKARTFPEVKQIWQSHILKHSDKCLKETGADYNQAIRLIPYGEFVDDHKLKCFLLCIADNLFAIHEDGSTHSANILDLMHIKDPEILEKSNVANKCFDINLPDKCDRFYAVVECLHNTLEEVIPKSE